MRTLMRLVLTATLCCATIQAAPLVRDFNTQPVPLGGYVFPWSASLAAGNLFVADDNVHGEELWISDGTPAGTHLLRDVNAGKASSEIRGFTVVNGVAYFYADDGVNGRELWRSDGSYAGTHIVANIGPGAQDKGGVEYASITTAGGVLYFTADEGVHGEELWRSDGTAAGTTIVADIVAGAGSSQIERLYAAGNRVFFVATDSAGDEPWISDGTAAGTHRVADVNPGAGGSDITEIAAVGSTVYFSAYDPVHDIELWRLAAGAELASLVVDFNTDPNLAQPPAGEPRWTIGSEPKSFVISGDSLLFSAVTTSGPAITNRVYRITPGSDTFIPLNDLGPQDVIIRSIPVGARGALFAVGTIGGTTEPTRAGLITDGTTAGSQSLISLDLWLSGLSFEVERSADGNEVYFYGRSQASFGPVQIWRSDGTLANTRVFADVPNLSGVWDAKRIGSRLFFSAGTHGDGFNKEMWVSDGTPAGTRRIRDLYPGEPSSQPYSPQVLGNHLIFSAFTPDDPATLWITDGTDAGTLPLVKISVDFETHSGLPYSIGASANDIFYLATDGLTGTSLWASDGTSAGTLLVTDITTGNDSTFTLPMMSLGGVQIFNTRDVIWRTDGTSAGTYPLADTAPNSTGDVWWPLYGTAPSVIGNTGYFLANDGAHNTLWRTDGSAAGTAMVTDITAMSPWVLGLEGALGNRLFFLGTNGTSSGTLYSSDATPGGTLMVSPNHQLHGPAKTFNGRLCFTGNDGVAHLTSGGSYFTDDIWCSNGNAGDLVRITDGFAASRSAGEFFVVDDLAFVNSYSQDATSGLWITDGNPATARQLLVEHASDVVRYGSNYLIATYDNPAGPRFLLSDGTIAGTRDLLQDANVDGTITGQFTLFAGYVMFTVRNSMGVVIWRTDGTPAGTRFVADVNPSTDDNLYPVDFRVLGNRLLFTSPHPVLGEELWMLTAVNPNATEDSLRAGYETPTSVDVLANDADIDGTLVAASVEVVDAPDAGTTSIDAATGAVIYTPGAGFTGIDSLTYRVRDNQGNWSNAARVSIIVSQPVGANPAAPVGSITPAPMPTPPPPSPPPNNPPGNPPGGSGGGGGGGALGLECAVLALMLLACTRRRPRRNFER